MIWARDFVLNQVMKISEYFVYCGIFIMQSWDKRSIQIAKEEFLERAKKKNRPGYSQDGARRAIFKRIYMISAV